MKPIDANNALFKMKMAGLADDVIAQRLGTTIEQVQKRWDALREFAERARENGYAEFCEFFTRTAHQYQLLGESLKVMGATFGSVPTIDEVEKVVVPGDARATAVAMFQAFIVLRPYVPVDPETAMKEQLRSN